VRSPWGIYIVAALSTVYSLLTIRLRHAERRHIPIDYIRAVKV
jgi:hypothetical protein